LLIKAVSNAQTFGGIPFALQADIMKVLFILGTRDTLNYFDMIAQVFV
jgi:hypothetical protein